MTPLLSRALLLTLVLASVAAGESQPEISPAEKDANGFLAHRVTSPYQSGTTTIRVLCPDHLDSARAYPVVYVLPVEPKDENRFGNGLLEVKKADLANRYDAIFVEPTFAQLPWYADHPTDPRIRQESYFLKVVIPFIEKTYPVRKDPTGRLLLGFSKSGWGAWCLLLRHPDLFGKAAAWDAPMMMTWPSKYGSQPIFGSAENFSHYQIAKLLEDRAAEFHSGKRLILLGYGNFHAEHQQVHALMEKLKIDEVYTDGPKREHIWGSGWLPEAVKFLLSNEEM